MNGFWDNAAKVGLLLVGLLLVYGVYSFGYVHAKRETYHQFEPDFSAFEIGDDRSGKCYVIVERVDGRNVFAGCKSEFWLQTGQARWKQAGVSWPYRVVAEFDRDIDGI